MTVKHQFVSPKTDGADATLVRPSDWNSGHYVESGSIETSHLTQEARSWEFLGYRTINIATGSLGKIEVPPYRYFMVNVTTPPPPPGLQGTPAIRFGSGSLIDAGGNYNVQILNATSSVGFPTSTRGALGGSSGNGFRSGSFITAFIDNFPDQIKRVRSNYMETTPPGGSIVVYGNAYISWSGSIGVYGPSIYTIEIMQSAPGGGAGSISNMSSGASYTVWGRQDIA